MKEQSQEQAGNLSPQLQNAIDELQSLIQHRYPGASFDVSRAPDEPENILLRTVVDLDDVDAVLDAVIDRLVEMQVEERIPIHVIPIPTPERILRDMQTRDRYPRTLPTAGPGHAGTRSRRSQ